MGGTGRAAAWHAHTDQRGVLEAVSTTADGGESARSTPSSGRGANRRYPLGGRGNPRSTGDKKRRSLPGEMERVSCPNMGTGIPLGPVCRRYQGVQATTKGLSPRPGASWSSENVNVLLAGEL